MSRTPLPLLILLAISLFATNVFARDSMGLKEPYEEAKIRMNAERAQHADNTANSDDFQHLSLAKQRAKIKKITDTILAADSIRTRLDAHAKLLSNVDMLETGLRDIVTDAQISGAERSVAVWALGERGTEQACEDVMRAVLDPKNALYTLSLAVAQGRCGNIEGLRSVLMHGTEYTRPRAAVTLGMLGSRRLISKIDALGKAAEDTKFEKDYILARGLLGERSTIPALKEMLNDRELHMHAAIALARMDEDYVVFDIRAATLSTESLIRWAAAKVIISKKLSGACEMLETLSTDDDARVVQLARGVVQNWRHEAATQWRQEGFAMDNFNSRAYCP